MDDVNALFDEYAVRRQRGDRPDIDEYLARAGDAADELRDLIEGLLLMAPSPRPHPDSLAIARAILEEEPPLAALRVRRGARRADVVDRILRAFGFGDPQRARVQDRYHELETGLLDPAGVDRGVIAAVAEALGVAVGDLPLWRPGPPTLTAEAAMTRSAAPLPSPVTPPAGPAAPEDPSLAEVDRLFGVR
jgi:hypothetical protein